MAIRALEQIAKHGAECGERWGETLNELKNQIDAAATEAEGVPWADG